MVNVFLTGGTGFLGRPLALRFARGGHDVQLLVRKNSRREARKWLAELRSAEPEVAGRFRLLTGDLTTPELLAPRDLEAMMASADTFVHCGAVSDPAADRAHAWNTNVHGTQAMVDLALSHGSLTRFVHLSDAAVAGDHRGPFGEEQLLVDQRFAGPCFESKMVAERRVRAARGRLPVTILRPSQLVAPAPPSPGRRGYGIYALLTRLARLAPLPGFVPPTALDRSARVDIVSVPQVAEATVELTLRPDAADRCVHLTDPDALALPDFVRRVASALGLVGGRSIVGVPRGRVVGGATRTVYDTRMQARLLRSKGLEAAPLDDYLPALLEYVRTHLV